MTRNPCWTNPSKVLASYSDLDSTHRVYLLVLREVSSPAYSFLFELNKPPWEQLSYLTKDGNKRDLGLAVEPSDFVNRFIVGGDVVIEKDPCIHTRTGRVMMRLIRFTHVFC